MVDTWDEANRRLAGSLDVTIVLPSWMDELLVTHNEDLEVHISGNFDINYPPKP